MKTLRSILYDFFLFLALPFLLLKKKELLGRGFPTTGGAEVIWIHAVSLGETKAVAPLAKALKEKYPGCTLILTSITKTGHEEGKKSLSFADHHLFLPLDISWIIRPVVRRVKPTLVLICETDLWPNFLQEAKKCGAKIALVNGKVSERTERRLKRFAFVANELFGPIDLFCVQSALYAKRFSSLGAKKVYVTGNLKCDAPFEKQDLDFAASLGLKGGKVAVVGSTHDPEERLLLEVFKKLWKEDPTLQVLFVPRHPERFDAVFSLLKQSGVSCFRYSEKKREGKAILIDAMGLLQKCYQLADVAIVAGSFVKGIGGHNILEPLAYGVPVLFGPYMESQQGFVELVKEYQAGEQVTLPELEESIKRFFASKEIGQRGKRLISDMKGATEKTLEILSCG